MTKKPMNHWAGEAIDIAQCYTASDSNDGGKGSIRISRNNEIWMMHRWIWTEIYGPIPDGWEIDHINGVRTDNRLDNLRCVPQAVNMRNVAKRKDNTSGVKGVSLWKTKRRGNQPVHMWRAVAIDQNGKQKIKTFSIKKYGNQGAFDLACEARKQMDIDFGYHPNDGR